MVERGLQLTIENMLTIGEIIIALEGFRKPEEKREIFQILAEEKIISRGLEKDLRGIAGFRNILVHNYVDLDLNLVYKNLVEGIPVFEKFAKQIAKFIGKCGKLK